MNYKKTTGIDIISKRFSSFEKKAIRKCLELKKDDVIYDIGSGQSYFSIVLAFLGKKVYAIDKDFEKFSFLKINILKKLFRLKNLHIHKKDISKMEYKDFENISLVYSGRFLHYLRYSEAQQLLKILRKKLKKGGMLYFSVSGIDSDLAKGYNVKNIKIENRFFKIPKNLQNQFSIKEKVCLYSETEARELFSQFFSVLEVSKTAFGNICITAVKE
jgi:SAM-dependent methyltransferase